MQIIMKEMSLVYGDSYPEKAMMYRSLFKQGKDSLENYPRSERNIKVTTLELNQKVEINNLDDARLKMKQLAEMVEVSHTTIFNIQHDYLVMTMISARWMPRMFTPPQKLQRLECSRLYLDFCNEQKDGVLSRVVTEEQS